MKIIAVIPARGGSRGIPRKNVRFLNGKPLIAYAITNALQSKYITEVFVSTDDEEIAHVAELYGAEVIKRPEKLGEDDVTLDPVIYHAVQVYEEKGSGQAEVVITMQPTSPLLRTKTLDDAIESFLELGVDTMISAVNKPHLSWRKENDKFVPMYSERLNRQYLPEHMIETGAFVITKREFINKNSRFGKNVYLFVVPDLESVDIDDFSDWAICDMQLKKKKIVIRTEGYPQIGLGHVYRSILLTANLMEHDVLIVLSEKSELGIRKVQEQFLTYREISNTDEFIELLKEIKPDILVNDILDTTEEYMKQVKPLAGRVINIEDMGEGGTLADAVINALYEKNRSGENYYWGYKYYCLREEFMLTKPKAFSAEVKEILVTFGGTDQGRYTEKVLDVIKTMPINEKIVYQFVLGLGFDREEEFLDNVRSCSQNIRVVKNVQMISKYMAKADIAISSQGRTIYELAAMKVPTIILAQNERERTHEFGYMKNGFINLGTGDNVEKETLRETLLWLIHTPQIRKQMRNGMGRISLTSGIDRVKNVILGIEK